MVATGCSFLFNATIVAAGLFWPSARTGWQQESGLAVNIMCEQAVSEAAAILPEPIPQPSAPEPEPKIEPDIAEAEMTPTNFYHDIAEADPIESDQPAPEPELAEPASHEQVAEQDQAHQSENGAGQLAGKIGEGADPAGPGLTGGPSAGEQGGIPSLWQVVRACVARHLRYPRSARERGVEGLVVVRLSVDSKGNLLDAVPTSKESDSTLTRSALEAISRAAPFPVPSKVVAATTISGILPIRFRLEAVN